MEDEENNKMKENNERLSLLPSLLTFVAYNVQYFILLGGFGVRNGPWWMDVCLSVSSFVVKPRFQMISV